MRRIDDIVHVHAVAAVDVISCNSAAATVIAVGPEEVSVVKGLANSVR